MPKENKRSDEVTGRRVDAGQPHAREPDSPQSEQETRVRDDSESPAKKEPQQAVFSPGDVIADRFRIVRFIAVGGMGEVYEAEDQELSEHVALKTIRPDIAQDEASMMRFRRETQLSRKVTHPNVCRIFDLFRHRGSDSESEVSFLTMELLSGETLATRLKRTGRMTTQEATPLVEQMASALDAAHKAGVVHRDFKPENVVLVDSDEGIRAVVTDFGLARRSSYEDDETVTGTGSIVGTPAYMAPEQVEGKEITPASDIYALGIVMYEMVTGVRPFTGDSPLVTAVKRLKEPPPSPKIHVQDLDNQWEAVILKCLERQPEARFEKAKDIPNALTSKVERGQRPYWKRPLVAALVLASLALVSAIAYLVRPSTPVDEEPVAVATVKARPSLAILGFKNLSGREEAAWLSIALSEMLNTELAASDVLRLVSGEAVARMKTALSLVDTESYANDTLEEIRKHLGVDFVVLGSYLAVGEGSERKIRLDLRLQDTRDGRSVTSLAETGSELELFDLVSKTGSHLRGAVGIGGLSSIHSASVRASLPRHPEATKLYSEGLVKARRFDFLGAQELLTKSIGIEPDFPLSHLTLSEVWSALGYSKRARDEVRKAFELSADLSRTDRLMIEARYRQSINEWAKAVEILQTLWSLYPDELEFGLRLHTVQRRDDRNHAAQRTLVSLKKLPPPSSKDPRIDLREAIAAEDPQQQFEASQRAVQKAEAIGAQHLLAEIYLEQGAILEQMERKGEALAAYEKAKAIFQKTGDAVGLTNVTRYIAWLQYEKDPQKAKVLLEEAIAISRTIGAKPQMARALVDLAGVLSNEGNYPEAKYFHKEALEVLQEIGDEFDVAAYSRNEYAFFLTRWRHLTRARDVYEENLETMKVISDKGGIAAMTNNLARVLEKQGELGEARRLQKAVVEMTREYGGKERSAGSLESLALIAQMQGELSDALEMYEEVLSGFEAVGSNRNLAYALRDRSDILWTVSDFSGAIRNLEKAHHIYTQLEDTFESAVTLADLAAVLRDQGKSSEAAEKIDEALALRDRANESGSINAGDLSRLAEAFKNGGNLEAAISTYRQDLAAAKKERNRRVQAQVHHDIADVLFRKGDVEGARESLDHSLSAWQELGTEAVLPQTLDALADLTLETAEFQEARRFHERALATQTQYGQTGDASKTRLKLARLAIEEGRLPEAEDTARKEAVECRQRTDIQCECFALSVLSRAYLAQNRISDASGTAESALELSHRIASRSLRAELGIISAKALAAGGQLTEAQTRLRTALDAAVRLSHRRSQLEARLASAELAMMSGDRENALIRLEELKTEAQHSGFILIAKKAAEALSM